MDISSNKIKEQYHNLSRGNDLRLSIYVLQSSIHGAGMKDGVSTPQGELPLVESGQVIQDLWDYMMCNSVQFGALQYRALQCSTVQCNAEQCSALKCSAVQCSAVKYKLQNYEEEKKKKKCEITNFLSTKLLKYKLFFFVYQCDIV